MGETRETQLGQAAEDVTKPDTGDLTLWSVTTIIGCLDKPALLYWAAQQTADAAIDNLATWQAMLTERGRAEASKWLRDARQRPRKDQLSAANLGTCAHSMCETYALTGVRPTRDDVRNIVTRAGPELADDAINTETSVLGQMLNQFDTWLNQFQPSYQATEVCVYHPTYGYAGQADAFLTIDSTKFLADIKTSRDTYDSRGQLRTPYPESVALQLAAYRHTEMAAVWRPRRFEQFKRRYYLLSEQERATAVPVPEVDTGLVIKLSPESCEAYPVRCDQEVFEAFLYVQEAFRWVTEVSKTVMGQPLQGLRQ